MCPSLFHPKLIVSELRLRQYPLYDKTAPPDALATHFTPDVFSKSQKYGKDKAQFALISSAFNTALEVVQIHFNAQVWAWSAAGTVLDKYGYHGYEVSFMPSTQSWRLLRTHYFGS